MRRFVLVLFICWFASPSFATARPPDVDQLAALYKELMGFKSAPKFKQVGFGLCCEYSSWLKRVKRLQAETKVPAQSWIRIGVLPGDLLTLGLEYVASKGGETSYSREMVATFEAALFPKPARKGFNGRLSDTDSLCRSMDANRQYFELLEAGDYDGASKLGDVDGSCPLVQKGTPLRGPLDKSVVVISRGTKKESKITFLLVEAQGVGMVWVQESWAIFRKAK